MGGLSLLFACGSGDAVGDRAARSSTTPTARSWNDHGPPVRVRVTGSDYRWLLTYAGADGRLDTADDVRRERHLGLPAGREVVFELASDDYVYTLYIPHLDLMEAAAPGPDYAVERLTGDPARESVLGSQMCGYTHPLLLGDLLILEEEDFAAWLSSEPLEESVR